MTLSKWEYVFNIRGALVSCPVGTGRPGRNSIPAISWQSARTLKANVFPFRTIETIEEQGYAVADC
ncbi:hypothetical protein [Mycobacterium leprae]|uniref:hypothetical protein n=1 Tax=Mycobacterium leprae TaxID=1769 RepID=UPI000305D2C4|nr:hypothetical protein [Mycobacterium leprae]